MAHSSLLSLKVINEGLWLSVKSQCWKVIDGGSWLRILVKVKSQFLEVTGEDV